MRLSRNVKYFSHMSVIYFINDFQYLQIIYCHYRIKLLWKKCSYAFNHSHKKRKDSLEARAAYSWILKLTWNFGGGRGNSASTFFKTARSSWFWCSHSCNWLFYMLDKDNIISTGVSEAVEKIPTDEKDCRKCSFIFFTLHSYSIQRTDQHISS